MAPFSIIPGFQSTIDSWRESLPEGSHPRDRELLKDFEREPITGAVDVLIIWDHRLPHGSSTNTS